MPPKRGIKRKYTPSFGASYNPRRTKTIKTSVSTWRRFSRPASKPEMKCVDVNAEFFFGNDPSTNTNINFINAISQGTGAYQRIGRKISIKSINLTYRIQPKNLPAPTTRLKVALVWDKHPDSATPAYNEIFNSLKQDGTSVSDVESLINLDHTDRFVILHSRMFSGGRADLNGNILVQNMDANRMTGTYIKSLSKTMTFKGAGSDLSDVQSGALYFVTFNSDATTAQQFWDAHMQLRLKYTD